MNHWGFVCCLLALLFSAATADELADVWDAECGSFPQDISEVMAIGSLHRLCNKDGFEVRVERAEYNSVLSDDGIEQILRIYPEFPFKVELISPRLAKITFWNGTDFQHKIDFAGFTLRYYFWTLTDEEISGFGRRDRKWNGGKLFRCGGETKTACVSNYDVPLCDESPFPKFSINVSYRGDNMKLDSYEPVHRTVVEIQRRIMHLSCRSNYREE